MTIKGTLETFNLRELLQMLSFNQKVGTLVLETERGTQTVHVDRGRVAFVQGDVGASRALLRVVRRRGLVPPDRLERALQIHQATGEFLGRILLDLGAVDQAVLREAAEQAIGERFLRLQLTAITRFEFADGQVLAPDGTEKRPDGQPRTPIEPGAVVEGLLLDLTRKMDHWVELAQVVPTFDEIYEGTGIAVDLSAALAEEAVDLGLAERIVQALDGLLPLTRVVDESDADELTVIQVLAALVQGGGVRPVSTDDLLARSAELLTRGEAERALPLLRRAVERGDGPAEARLRLADALEATGDGAEAAGQLDRYAQEADETKPAQIFDAVHRALALRDGDLSTAARLTDYYVQNRPWLQERKAIAIDVLRTLIHRAVASRQPLEAADRLKDFIDHDDAPTEDLLVLADLYASGGDRAEAAAALFRRADELLLAGRTGPARDLLRRTLQLDGSRGDARGRLHVLDGEQRKRRQKRRITVAVVVLGLVLLGMVGAWWTYNQEAGRSIRRVRERAERAVDRAERDATLALEAFESRLTLARTAPEPDGGLAAAAHGLTQGVADDASATEAILGDFATEILRYRATDHEESNTQALSNLRARLGTLHTRAEQCIATGRREGREALSAGEHAHGDGRFVEARRLLLLARNLAFDDETVANRADLLLTHVDRYVAEFERALGRFEAARAAGDVATTFQHGVEMLARLLDSDLTRRVLLPVHIATTPPGAQVRLGGTVTGHMTPCTLEYSPFEATTLTLSLPGHVSQRLELPDFGRIAADPESVKAWVPSRRVDMPAGPRWRVDSAQGPFRAVWASKDVPVLLRRDGAALQPVVPQTGELGIAQAFRRHEPVQAGGTLPGGFEWRIIGQCTLVVRPTEAEPWEVQVLGHLQGEPTLLEGTVAVVDERGNAYGFDALTGQQRWRQSLGAAPAQRAYPTRRGIVVTTVDGAAHLIQPGTGQVRPLASSARGLLLALPLGEGVALLGGAGAEARVLSAAGTLERVGHASPSVAAAWVSAQGVAWIEADGVHWLGTSGEPRAIPALGPAVSALSGQGTTLYAVGTDGVVRAADISAPDALRWSCDVGAATAAPPLPLGDTLYVLVEGGLVALAR